MKDVRNEAITLMWIQLLTGTAGVYGLIQLFRW
jgi:hypothetical protein